MTFQHKNTCVVKQHREATALYIIIEGEVKLTRTIAPKEYISSLEWIQSASYRGGLGLRNDGCDDCDGGGSTMGDGGSVVTMGSRGRSVNVNGGGYGRMNNIVGGMHNGNDITNNHNNNNGNIGDIVMEGPEDSELMEINQNPGSNSSNSSNRRQSASCSTLPILPSIITNGQSQSQSQSQSQHRHSGLNSNNSRRDSQSAQVLPNPYPYPNTNANASDNDNTNHLPSAVFVPVSNGSPVPGPYPV